MKGSKKVILSMSISMAISGMALGEETSRQAMMDLKQELSSLMTLLKEPNSSDEQIYAQVNEIVAFQKSMNNLLQRCQGYSENALKPKPCLEAAGLKYDQQCLVKKVAALSTNTEVSNCLSGSTGGGFSLPPNLINYGD